MKHCHRLVTVVSLPFVLCMATATSAHATNHFCCYPGNETSSTQFWSTSPCPSTGNPLMDIIAPDMLPSSLPGCGISTTTNPPFDSFGLCVYFTDTSLGGLCLNAFVNFPPDFSTNHATIQWPGISTSVGYASYNYCQGNGSCTPNQPIPNPPVLVSSSFPGFAVCQPQCPSNTCGVQNDGCGATIQCSCAAGTLCISNGTCCTPNHCGTSNTQCGAVSDGCGGTLQCGSCPTGQVCSNGSCVCTPSTCSQQGRVCGRTDNGCGTILDCGSCPTGMTCSADGRSCMPCPSGTSCSTLGYVCGEHSNACGAAINCGTCPTGQACRADGRACIAPGHAVPAVGRGFTFAVAGLIGLLGLLMATGRRKGNSRRA